MISVKFNSVQQVLGCTTDILAGSMTDNTIEEIVNGSFVDAETGQVVSVPVDAIVIAPNLDGSEQDLVKSLGFGTRLAVVSDLDTREALGRRVESALASIAIVNPITLPQKPHADMETAQQLQQKSRLDDGLIAVGSGTINDLCKYAAHQTGKPYAVFGTAPSMNGYTSPNASIMVYGLKKTLPATMAKGVFLDLKVMTASPKQLIRSGLGDVLCRSTAQADWLLAHRVLDRPYQNLPYSLLAADETLLLSEAGVLLTQNMDAIERLTRTLVLSGFGMFICQSSQPASQGEHLIAHYMDMMGEPNQSDRFHGEQIGVTTLTMARIQEYMLNHDPPKIKPTPIDKLKIIQHFGKDLGSACWQEFQQKRLDEKGAEQMNTRLNMTWDSIRKQIMAVMEPEQSIRDALQRVGAPVAFTDLNWSEKIYGAAVRHAREIRNRYTFLDLVGDSVGFDAGFNQHLL